MTEQNISQTAGTRKKLPRILLRSAAGLLFLLMALAVAFLTLLPGLVERKVNELLAGFTERSKGGFRIIVREIGLARTTLSIVSTAPENAREAEPDDFGIGSVSLAYTPRGLLAKSHIDAIRIDDVRLPVLMEGGTFRLPVLERIRKSGSQKTKDKTEPFRLNSLPVTVGRLELTGSVRLGVRRSENAPVHDELILPVRARIVSLTGRWDKLELSARVSGSVNTLEIKGTFDAETNRAGGRIDGVFDTRTMPFALREYSEKYGHGTAELGTDFAFDLNGMKLEHAEGTLRAGIQAKPAASLQIDCRPVLTFSFERNQLRLTLEDLGCTAAGKNLRIPRAETDFDMNAMNASGKILLNAEGIADGLLSFGAKRTDDGSWHLELPELKLDAGQWDPALFNGLTLRCGAPDFSAQADLTSEGIPFKVRLSVKDITLEHPNWSARVGEASFDAEGNARRKNIVSNLLCKDVRGTYGKIHAAFPEFRADAGLISSRLFASVLMKDGTCSLPDQQIQLEGIRFSQTAQPFEECDGPGSFAVKKIQLRGQDLGSVSGKTVLQGKTLRGTASAELCGMKAESSFSAGLGENGFELTADLDVPEQKIPENLADFFPEQIGDKKISGLVKLGGAYAIRKGKQSGNAKITLKDGAVSSESMKLDVSGIHAEAEFPNLPELRTSPDQPLFCRAIRYNNIQANTAIVKFRLDNAHSFCIERLALNWCSGKVRMECTYLDTESDQLSVTIHCDRLDLLEFLTQVGAGKGTGNGGGRISGTMPVRYKKKDGSITVHDAFLYSTPGEEGKIEFVLSDSIRESQIQTTAFDMTQDALRNFLYSWAKVQMKTEGDTLKLQLQLNGKPAAPLYYSYDSTGLVKSKVPHNFQGILLDVNLNLPFEILLDLFNDFKSMKK